MPDLLAVTASIPVASLRANVGAGLRTLSSWKTSDPTVRQEGGGVMYIGAGTVIAIILIVLLIMWLT
jgi:hypothetical protein